MVVAQPLLIENCVITGKGGIGSGETLCHDIYPARPITTVSLAVNTYCMMDGHSSCSPRTVGPRVQFSDACEQSHRWPARHTAGGHPLSVFKQRLILSVSKPGVTIKPSVPAREFNLEAYTAITWHNDRASLGLEPRLADHHSQAARTAMLPIAPLRQAQNMHLSIMEFLCGSEQIKCVWWDVTLFRINCFQNATVITIILSEWTLDLFSNLSKLLEPLC